LVFSNSSPQKASLKLAAEHTLLSSSLLPSHSSSLPKIASCIGVSHILHIASTAATLLFAMFSKTAALLRLISHVPKQTVRIAWLGQKCSRQLIKCMG
jgi:hypothetical protein